MRRRIFIFLMMMCMALNMAGGVFAEETVPDETLSDETSTDEETSSGETGTESSPYRIWQGYIDDTSYTILINAESGTASVAGTMSDGSVSIVSGTADFDDANTLTITSDDGTVAVIKAESVSSCQSLAVYNDTSFTLVQAAPVIADSINEYAWYSGLSAEGDAYTFGISTDCSKLVFAFYTPGDETLYQAEFTLEVTASGNGTIVASAYDADGNVYDFSYEMIGENPLHAVFTLNGEFCEAYAVEARIFDSYTEETI